jgi:hypothetical protein
MNPVALARFLADFRFSLSDEKKTQQQIAEQLTLASVVHRREVRLSDGDIIDFMVSNTGIEVKLKGQKMEIYRQIERYCQHDEVTSLVLATNVAMGVPPSINGKPIYVVNLGRAWL